MNEQEIRERREKIRVIVTEVFMFFSAIALVVFLTLIVMGYNFSFKRIGTEEEVIQRSGLVQVSSRPTGAAILIDGNSTLLLRTNGSRTAAAGEHEISLSREGYGVWKKTINVTEGLMYRLNYPRLFPVQREEEEVFDLTGVEAYFSSEDGGKMLVFDDGIISELNLNSSKIAKKSSSETVEVSSMKDCMWSANNEKVLCKFDGKFGVVDFALGGKVSLVDEYLNAGVTGVKFETETGDRILYIDENNRLVEFSLSTKTKNLIGKDKVKAFDNDGDKIVYIDEKSEAKCIQVGEEEGVEIGAKGVKQALTMEYFQETLFALDEEDGELVIFSGVKWPSEGEESELEELFRGEMAVRDGVLKKRGNGMVFSVEGAQEKAVFDVEAGEVKEFTIAGENGWVDEYLRFEVRDGELWVVDYDGNNWVQIASEGVTEKFVKISSNNKYIYYIKDKVLYRQKI